MWIVSKRFLGLRECFTYEGLKKSQKISWFVYVFTPFFTAVYIIERLVIKTIYVLNKELLQLLGAKSPVYNQECFQIKSGS